MTDFKEAHRLARRRVRFSGFEDLWFLRDERGFMGVTRKGDKRASIANMLKYAANERGYPIGHRTFIDRIRLTRKTIGRMV